MEELSAAAPPNSAAGRLAQQVLAATLTLGSLAYSIGVTRSLGLVVFPEQFLGTAYGVCLAILFVSFPARRGTPRADMRWFDCFFAIEGLAAGICGAIHFPRITARAGTGAFELLLLAGVIAFL